MGEEGLGRGAGALSGTVLSLEGEGIAAIPVEGSFFRTGEAGAADFGAGAGGSWNGSGVDGIEGGGVMDGAFLSVKDGAGGMEGMPFFIRLISSSSAVILSVSASSDFALLARQR